MELKKFNPWNWFKKEDELNRQSPVPVHRAVNNTQLVHPIEQFHNEIDRMFDGFFRGFGFPSMMLGREFPALVQSEWLKPNVDIAEGEKEYSITVEIPGVEEKDFSLELSDGTLRIRGEKKHEKEEKDLNYYRMERSYGSFQRLVSLPEDVDEAGISARYSNGVLKITLPRRAMPKQESRKIQIGSGKESSGPIEIAT